MKLEKINERIKEEKEKLEDTKKNHYKVENLDGLNNGELEREMVNLPNLEFVAKVRYIGLDIDLKLVQQQIQQILDSTILDIAKNGKEQYTTVRQREARANQLLKDSKTYFALQTLEGIMQEHINYLKNQCDYYSEMCRSLKKIYSIRNELLLADKKVKGIIISRQESKR
jgi:hypothetical protein